MTLSDNGFTKLVEFEGCRLESYADQGGVWTIGIGSIKHPDGSKVVKGEVIDKATAEAYVRNDLIARELIIKRMVTSAINQDQYDMIVSLCYNIGTVGFGASSALKSINSDPTLSNSYDIIHNWKKWNKVKQVVIPGLLKRRNKELFTFFSSKLSEADIVAIL